MKRSRTCLCLVELDAPKRTRSTPDLGALRRKHHLFARQHNNNADDLSMGGGLEMDIALRTFPRAVSPPAPAPAGTPASAQGPLSPGSPFVVDSIVRSKGSLNEITILEHEQFIGEESDQSSSTSSSGVIIGVGEQSPLFGRTMPGSLFEDSGDSSDYFCGVASSDEAEEDGACRTAGSSPGGALSAARRSDTDDAEQASADATGIAAAAAAAPSDIFTGADASLPSWTTPFGRSAARTSSSTSSAAGADRSSTGEWWKSASPRVTVRIRSPRDSVVRGGGSVASLSVADRQRADTIHQPATVSPPWPAVAAPANRWRDTLHWQRREYDGPLVSVGDDVKDLIGLDRLRLVDFCAPVVEM